MDFNPQGLLKNAHVQSIAASIKLRRPLVRHRARRFLDRSRTRILDCGDGVRLQGAHTAHGGRRPGYHHSHPWVGRQQRISLHDLKRLPTLRAGL